MAAIFPIIGEALANVIGRVALGAERVAVDATEGAGKGIRKTVQSTYQNNTGVRVTKQNFDDVVASVRNILDVEILVGVPSDTTERPPGLDPQNEKSITNAALAYIHDQGAPEARIPQREFMRPGIATVQGELQRKMGIVMKLAMRGDAHNAERAMHQVGLIAQSAIRNYLDLGVPPPLSEATLKKRAERGGKSSIARAAMTELDRRLAGLNPSLNYAKPLIDTGEMRKSIKYVIRQRRRR